MKIIKYPSKENWKQVLQRPAIDNTSLQERVKDILNGVKQKGDAAIRQFTTRFDGVILDDFTVSQEEINEAIGLVSDELKQAIQQAAANVEMFHKKQLLDVEIVETMPGVQCWRKSIGIETHGY